MTLSEEWLDFIASLCRGPVAVAELDSSFQEPEKARRLLGEIIRQGLVDLDDQFTMISVTPKGRYLVRDRIA